MRALLAAGLLAWPALVGAQAPAAQSPPTQVPPASDAYSYQIEGRRDPFVSLVGTGPEPQVAGKRAEGPAGLLTGEISVRGVMQSKGALIAMIQGPDNRTWVVHQGDKLMDGVVRSVTTQGLVIVQDVNDPLSLVKQREVRKLLRSLEDAKE